VLAAAAEFKCMTRTRWRVTGKVYCIYIALATNNPYALARDIAEVVLEFKAAPLFVEWQRRFEHSDSFLAELTIPVHLAAAVV
jgi:hypothetical protein